MLQHILHRTLMERWLWWSSFRCSIVTKYSVFVPLSKGDVRRSIKLANFCGRGLVVRENRRCNRWTMTHGRFCLLQLRTISASFTDTKQQNENCEMILALFFLHLMNENKHRRVTNRINNLNKYSSPTVNNHHGDRYPKSWPILLSKIERVGR